jgi:GWxTD domain-containing protein
MFSQRRNHALNFSFCSCALLAFLAAGSFSMGAAPASAGQGKQKLEKHYKEWFERDVAYIITKDERDVFLKLTSDEARDKFIQEFWDIRNPTPGSPDNSYKDEIYQRIAFADSRFGIGSGTDGWRTDRGRTYITLGAPQQKQTYRNAANLRGIEVWFYSMGNPSLPSAFYVMFYEKNGTGDYRFYSPYFDGPDKLTTGVEAQNSRRNGLHMILESVGGELERISLSLIPGEPVDFQTATSSLQSDTMLSILKSLADQPANRDEINRRRMMRESVTSSMILEGRNLDIIMLPVRDSRGLTRLDYAVRLRNPSDLAVSTSSDGRFTYSIEVQVRVFGENNKLIFVQQKPASETFDKHRYTEIKDKALSYEGMLPLPAGKYRLAFQFTDWTKGASYRTEREVTIPAVEADKFGVPGILPFLAAEPVDPATAEVTPFALAGVKFTPLPTSGLILSPDMNLQVAYQIWGPARDPRTLTGQKLHLEYALGLPSAPGSAKIIQDEADMAQFDADGTLVNGKKLELLDKQSGNYILTVAVNNPDSTMRGFARMNFKVSEGASMNAPWDVLEPSIRKDIDSGVFDQQRGLCYLNQGLLDEGRGWLRRALNTNHGNEPARAHLVEAYYAKQDYAAVVSLYKDTGLTDSADSETYLRIANSLQKTGNVTGAISLLEAGLQAHPQDVALYLGLADFYKQTGNTQKAEELIRKGKSYAPAS